MRNPTLLLAGLLITLGWLASAKAQTAAAPTNEAEPAVAALPPLPTIVRAIKEPTPAHMRAAEQVWQQDRITLGADMLTRYALALALVANNRHANAFTLMESTPEAVRKAGPLRRLWIWLAVKTKKDDVATHEMQTLIIDLGQRAANPQPPTANDIDDLQFAAQMVVYLEQIAERELPLDAAQAKAWWKRLEALPPPWPDDLAALRADILQEKAKQREQLKTNHAAWLTKTNKELLDAQERINELAPKEKETREKLEMVTTQHQAFLKVAEPQMETCRFRIAQSQSQLRALREPLEPGEPADERGNRVVTGPLRTVYEQRLQEYRQALRQYVLASEQLNSTLTAFTRQAAELTREDNAFKSTIAQGQSLLKKQQTPLQNARKTQERLQKTMSDNALWDSPSNLVNLRTLELYHLLSLTAEAERIERKRN